MWFLAKHRLHGFFPLLLRQRMKSIAMTVGLTIAAITLIAGTVGLVCFVF
jgi:hypothetical protein